MNVGSTSKHQTLSPLGNFLSLFLSLDIYQQNVGCDFKGQLDSLSGASKKVHPTILQPAHFPSRYSIACNAASISTAACYNVRRGRI